MEARQTSLFNHRPALGPRQLRVNVRKAKATRIDSSTSTLPCSEKTVTSSAVREEWAFVQQAIAGDSRAQEQIFACQTTMLRQIAFNILHNKEDAEDAVQDGLCRAYARLRSFQGKSLFSTWLTRIVINSALMIRRRKNTRPEASLDEILDRPEQLRQRIIDGGPNPEEICRRAEIHRRVDAQVRQLPPGLRAAFQLSDFDGLSVADSSQALGIRKSAFKSRLSRARQRVASDLKHALQTPMSRVPQGAAEISPIEIALSWQARSCDSPVFGDAKCQ